MKGSSPDSHIDLGLAILAAIDTPPHTCATIAAYCGVSKQRIHQIEQKALRKLRVNFLFHKDPVLRDLAKQLDSYV